MAWLPICFAATLALSSPVAGQSPAPPASAPAGLVSYLDRAYGFEIALPAGWQYDRTSFPGPEGSTGILRGSAPTPQGATHLAGRATLQVLIFRPERPTKFALWIEHFARHIGRISGTERVTTALNEDAPRPEAIVAADAALAGEPTLTLYYCVEFDPQTFWVLALATVVGNGDDELRAAARGGFEQITGTLRVLYNAEESRRLAEALVQGVEFKRAQLEDYAKRVFPDEQEHCYLLFLSGRPLGYLTRQFMREQRPGIDPKTATLREGLRVREKAWRFDPDGAAVFTLLDLFSTNDLSCDLMEVSRTRIPPPSALDRPTDSTARRGAARAPGPFDLVESVDQCVREGNTLFVTYRSSAEAGTLPDPRRPLQVDSSYLGLAWVRLLPGLLGTKAGPARAFVVYDVETRALATHWIEPLGARDVPQGESSATASAPSNTTLVPGAGGAPARGYAYRTREGFGDVGALLWTDERGVLLRLESGELVIRKTPQADVERQFGPLREAAAARAAALQKHK